MWKKKIWAKLRDIEMSWEKAQPRPCMGVAVQPRSLVVFLSNEALWSSGSHPSLGPHTSLMFPHHSPDNYQGRECHLSWASSTEADSTRSVVCQTRRESAASHTHTHTPESLHAVANMPILYPKRTICRLITLTTQGTSDSFVPAGCSNFQVYVTE